MSDALDHPRSREELLVRAEDFSDERAFNRYLELCRELVPGSK
jgi:hypothetical protein